MYIKFAMIMLREYNDMRIEKYVMSDMWICISYRIEPLSDSAHVLWICTCIQALICCVLHMYRGVTRHKCTGRWEAHLWDAQALRERRVRSCSCWCGIVRR